MRRLVVGTAGHIDHGKTALVKALTGIDTDRLQEEKERGISIDLGFAYLGLAGGVRVGVVDVPGHERFIKNMLAGAGGIDLVLFVVACDEGIMPQTREHFDIVSLLGVRYAVFALTKSDMVDEEMIDAVREEVRGFISATQFRDSPIVATSVETGRGLDELRRVLEQTVAKISERAIGEAVRLPVDRVFSMAGRGTVVTGTLWSGEVSVEDRLVVEPGAKPVRVRSVEVHGESVAKALAGQRTALGLHGVERSDVERGYCVVSPGDFEPSSIVDVELALLASTPKPLESRARIRFHLGASETIGRIFLLDRESLAPGATCHAQARLEAPVVAGFGDRYVLRTYSPMRTIGGGRVLDPAADGHKRGDPAVLEHLKALAAGDLAGVAESHLRRSGHGLAPSVLRKKLSCGPGPVEAIAKALLAAGKVVEMPGGLLIHASGLSRIEAQIETILKAYKAENRLTWGMPREQLRERLGTIDLSFMNHLIARLEADGRLSVRKGSVRAGGAGVDLSPAEARTRALTLDLLKQGMLQPPTEKDLQAEARIPADVFRKVVSLLIEDGEIVRLEPGIVVAKAAIDQGSAVVRAYLKEHGEATAGDLKTALGTTRKYAVPLLEYLDRMGVTRRKGDKRSLVG